MTAARALRAVLPALLSVVLAAAALAQVDPADLSREERRSVQAALARAGHYDGLIDGAFGARSASALGAWRAAGGDGSIARLMRDFDRSWRDEGWAGSPVRGLAQHFVAPFGLMRPVQDATADHAWMATDGRILVSVHREAPAAMKARHDTVAYLARPGSETYRLRRETLWITAVDSGTGPSARRHYLRSQRVGGTFETLMLRADAADPGIMMLMAGSITAGPVQPPAVPAGGRLAALVGAGLAAGAPDRRPVARLITAVGVNATDAVTAAAVLDGCFALAGPDGRPVRIVARDGGSGLALLRFAGNGGGAFVAVSSAGVPPPGTPLRLGGLQPGGMALDLAARVVAARAGVFVAGDPGVLDPALLTPGRFAMATQAAAVEPGWVLSGPDGALTGLVVPFGAGDVRSLRLVEGSEAVLRLLIEAGAAFALAGEAGAGSVTAALRAVRCLP